MQKSNEKQLKQLQQLLQEDLQKAFDLVDHEILQKKLIDISL